jgi:ubiquitin carboxyl-terminal hydrolase 10
VRSRQDSQEFLVFLLNGLDEELKDVMADDQNDKESPITKIFEGHTRSILYRPGADDSATLEPYKNLPLDIHPEHIDTVEEAIANMTIPEEIDIRTKTVYLDDLSTVLILHLKRFVFDNVGGIQKLSKSVRYGSKLEINSGKTGSYSCYLQRERELCKLITITVVP